MAEEFNLVRVIYGKKDMPLNKREYRVREFDSSAVGSIKEIKDFLKDKGYSKFRFVLHDPISEKPPIHSIDYDLTKKKPIMAKNKKGWVSESARHSLASRGIKTYRKKKALTNTLGSGFLDTLDKPPFQKIAEDYARGFPQKQKISKNPMLKGYWETPVYHYKDKEGSRFAQLYSDSYPTKKLAEQGLKELKKDKNIIFEKVK